MINKSLKIILVLLLSIVAIGLGIFLYILINTDFKFDANFIRTFNNSSNTLIESKECDEVNNIYINSNVADVYIEHSEDNKIKVELYSDNNKSHNISLVDNDLKIELEEDTKKTFLTKQARIVLYVPSDYDNAFDITNKVGDIKSSGYENATFKVSLTTGDVKVDKANILDVKAITGDIKNNQVNKVKVDCTTGDIKLGKVNKKLELKTATGDVKIDNIILIEDSSINTTIGDVKINNKNNIYVETDVKTGDVNINKNNRFANATLYIKVTTGDIKVG